MAPTFDFIKPDPLPRLTISLSKQMLIPNRNWSRRTAFASLFVLILVTGIVFGSAQTNTNSNADTASNKTVVLTQPLTLRWRYESNLTLNLTPAADEERVYLPLAGGTMVSLMAASGQ